MFSLAWFHNNKLFRRSANTSKPDNFLHPEESLPSSFHHKLWSTTPRLYRYNGHQRERDCTGYIRAKHVKIILHTDGPEYCKAICNTHLANFPPAWKPEHPVRSNPRLLVVITNSCHPRACAYGEKLYYWRKKQHFDWPNNSFLFMFMWAQRRDVRQLRKAGKLHSYGKNTAAGNLHKHTVP